MAVTNSGEGQNPGDTVSTTNSATSGTAFATVNQGSGQTIKWSSSPTLKLGIAVRFVMAGTALSIVDLVHPTPAASWVSTFYLYFTSMAGAAQTGFPASFRSGTDALLGGMDMDSTNHVRITAGSTSSAYSSGALTSGTLYRVVLSGTGFGTSSSAVTATFYSGESATVVATCSVSGATTSGTFAKMRFGRKDTGTSTAIDVSYDDFYLETGTTTDPGPTPTGNAGADQAGLEPGDTVTLVALYTGSWSQAGGSPTVTLAGAGATRTFTAPATLAGTTLTFGYGGDTMTVAVLAATERAVIGGVEVPMLEYQVSS